MYTYRYIVHTLTNDRSVLIVRSPVLSCALLRPPGPSDGYVGISDMSLKKVQVANHFGFFLEKYGYCLVAVCH